LITGALRKARIIPAEQPIQAIDLQTGLTALNLVIKHWQAQGIHLWSETEAIIPLVTGQRKYLLGPGGAEIAEANTFVNTTLTADHIATDTVIALADTTGMEGAPDILESDVTTSTQDWTATNSAVLTVSSGINIENGAASTGGAEYELEVTAGETYRVNFGYTKGSSVSATFEVLNGGVVADTTTLTATGTGTLTITAVTNEITFSAENTSAVMGEDSTVSSLNYILESSGDRIGVELDDGARQWTDIISVDSSTQVTLKEGLTGAASSGESVYSYENQIDRPIRVLNAQFGETLTASEIPVEEWSREDYFDQSDKDSSGTIVQWYYSPQLTLGELYVWQVASSVNQVVRFTYVRPLDIPTDQIDSVDIPSEWYMPLEWAIAAEIGPSYGIPDNRQLVIESKAASTLEKSMGHDVERDSMAIQPDFN
jgi:hypothetical protein